MYTELCPISGETAQEERLNHLTHLFGLFLSLAGFAFLVAYACYYGDASCVVSSLIYCTTLVMLYAASTFYHGCQTLEKKVKLRTLDHACIYLLIAGSYTPFSLGPLKLAGGYTILGVEWGIAAAGILFKLFFGNRFRAFSLASYLVMGWLVVFSWPALTETLAASTLAWMVLGGIFYSAGTIFFVWENLHMNHAIWHLFVLGGSISHFIAIMDVIVI